MEKKIDIIEIEGKPTCKYVSNQTFYDNFISHIDYTWILSKMNESNRTREEIMCWLGFDKASLSLILSGKRKLTKTAKCAFFYYFKYRKIHAELVGANIDYVFKPELQK